MLVCESNSTTKDYTHKNITFKNIMFKRLEITCFFFANFTIKRLKIGILLQIVEFEF